MKKYSILLIISMLTIILIAGCGGGGGSTGVIPNNGSVTTIDPTATPGILVEVHGNPTATPGSTIPSNLPTGTFKVEVQFPGSGSGLRAKELTGSDLPYNSHTLRVTITGEAIATSIVGERNDLDPTGAGTYTLTVSNVPVGLNTATIEVLDPSGNLLCQRKHGFYMTPGATEGPGLILLGVAIQGDGSYVPQNIDIPQGSSISFQNHDYTNDRTASMNSGAVTAGPIGHATHITQPVTAEVFPAVNKLFNTQGQFNYDGQTGRVLVYGLPTLTSVTPDKDSTNGTTSVSFTLAGTNFGTSQASVNGAVNFIQVNENDPNNPWGTVYNPSSFSSWGNTSIAGTINLPAGKYRIEVSVRGENTIEEIFFYKGTGNYQVIVGENWVPVGNVGFSDGSAGNSNDGQAKPVMAFYNGTPYVAYGDLSRSGKATVMKFNGTSWIPVGTPGFSYSGVINWPSFRIDNNSGTPYLAYVDSEGTVVKKYDGSSWITVGSPVTVARPDVSLDIYNNTPYIAYSDGGPVTVKKFDGTNWINVGNAKFSTGSVGRIYLKIYNETPYVSYLDWANSNRVTVMKFNGTSWISVGNQAFTSSQSDCVSMAIYNNIPYVAYVDVADNLKVSVMKFNGTSWEYVGTPHFSAGGAEFPYIFIYNSTPYVFYKDFANGGKATVMKFNGTNWESVGIPGFSAGQIYIGQQHTLYVDNGIPYVTYRDQANGGKATVMKLD